MTDTPDEGIPIMVRRTNLGLSTADPYYLALSHIYKWMETTALSAASGDLLDFGCGGQPYRELFETKVSRYIAADVQVSPGRSLDVVLVPGAAVPMPGDAVDTILSTQTLEHVSDPAFYLTECYRLMRKGGALILTAPMQWRHHEVPYDYFRYTPRGLEMLVERAGFKVESMTRAGGAFALIAQVALNAMAEHKVARPWMVRVINRIAMWLDQRYPDANDTINLMCIARKA